MNEWLIGIGGFAGALIVNEVVGWIKKRSEDERSELRAELKKNTEAVLALTLSIQRAEIEMKHLSDKVISIPEIQKDLNLLGAKVRRMEGGNGRVDES